MDFDLLRASADALRGTVEHLGPPEFAGPSRLPGWTRAHVVAHLAGAATSRRRLLEAARSGRVGRQYPSEDARSAAIERIAAWPADVLRTRMIEAIEGLLAGVAAHPAEGWDEPGEWLGVGRRPVAGVVPSMRREIEYHHVDLDAGYDASRWPDDFVRGQLPIVVETMARRPGAPQVTIMTPERTWRIGNGKAMTVAGDPAAVLAWLTGRDGSHTPLEVQPPQPPPRMPPLA